MKIDERFCVNGYIDFLRKDDFANHNVIYGKDNTNRFFISVLYKQIRGPNYTRDYNIMTLFQRYANEPYYFISCGDTFIYKGDIQTHHFLQNNIENPLPTQFQRFFQLINNTEIQIKYNVNKLYNLDDEYYDREKGLYYMLYVPEINTK